MSTIAPPPLDLNPAAIRERLHLSRERMARALRVSAKTVERWEQRQTLPDDEAVQRTFAQLSQIADLAHTLEATMGYPVDIECAYAKGKLYLLQCRPITTLL